MIVNDTKTEETLITRERKNNYYNFRKTKKLGFTLEDYDDMRRERLSNNKMTEVEALCKNQKSTKRVNYSYIGV